MRSRNSFVLLVVLGALTVLIRALGIARADGLLANWMFNEPMAARVLPTRAATETAGRWWAPTPW